MQNCTIDYFVEVDVPISSITVAVFECHYYQVYRSSLYALNLNKTILYTRIKAFYLRNIKQRQKTEDKRKCELRVKSNLIHISSTQKSNQISRLRSSNNNSNSNWPIVKHCIIAKFGCFFRRTPAKLQAKIIKLSIQQLLSNNDSVVAGEGPSVAVKLSPIRKGCAPTD